MRVPYEEMGGYSALEKRDALVIPLNEETLAIFGDKLNIPSIPEWPKSAVYAGLFRDNVDL